MTREFSPTTLAALMAAQQPKPLTPYGLAKRIRSANPHLSNCKRQHVDAWLAGVVPGGNYLPAIAAALGVTLEVLYETRMATIDAMLANLGSRDLPMFRNRRIDARASPGARPGERNA